MNDIQRFWINPEGITPEPADNGQWLRYVDVDRRRMEVNAEVILLNQKLLAAETELEFLKNKAPE